jgi:hypothetical protein
VNKKNFVTPSQAERFFNCPGSVKEQKKIDFEEESSPYAIEGVAVHELAAMCLQKKCFADDFLGEILEIKYGTEHHEIEVTQDFVDAVNLYRQTILEVLNAEGLDEGVLDVEQYDTLDDVLTEGKKPYGGTVDCRFIAGTTLHVVDLKGGRGVIVSPEENKQCLSYAVKAVEQAGMFIDKVKLWIIQPLAREGDYVKTWETTPERILSFKVELMEAIQRTKAKSPALQQGSWCKWCLAVGNCPAIRGEITKQAGAVMPNIQQYFPSPKTLTGDQIGRALPALYMLKDYLEGLEGYALSLLRKGEDVPNFVLVRGSKNRIWRDEQAVIDFLSSKYDEGKYMTEPKLRTVAQVEKVVGKGELDDYIMKPEGELKITLQKEVKDHINRSVEEVFKDVQFD